MDNKTVLIITKQSSGNKVLVFITIPKIRASPNDQLRVKVYAKSQACPNDQLRERGLILDLSGK